MLKDLLTLPFLALFQPEGLESRLNKLAGRKKKLVIWLHILALPVLFLFNFLAFSVLRGFSDFRSEPSYYVIIPLIIAVSSYVVTIILAFFVSGLIKKDNLTSFMIGTYWSFLFNLLPLFFFYTIGLWRYYYPLSSLSNEQSDEIAGVILFLFFAALFLSICLLIINIYGKTKQFPIIILIICLSSFSVTYYFAVPYGINQINYLFVTDETTNRKYIFLANGVPKRVDKLWSLVPSTSVDESTANHLVNVETGEREYEDALDFYSIRKAYTLDDKTLKDIEENLLKPLQDKEYYDFSDRKYYASEVKKFLSEIKKIETTLASSESYGSYEKWNLFNEGQFISDLKDKFHKFEDETYRDKRADHDENYFVKLSAKFSKATTLVLRSGTYKLNDQDANNFNQSKKDSSEYKYKNLKISEPRLLFGDTENKIRIENEAADSDDRIQEVDGTKIVAFVPLKNELAFLQTEVGLQLIDVNTGKIRVTQNEGWYADAAYELQTKNRYSSNTKSNQNTNVQNTNAQNTNAQKKDADEKFYQGDVIYSLSPSGYLMATQIPGGETFRKKSIYADEIKPLRNWSFYYVFIYYTFAVILISYLGFYRIPIYAIESIVHAACTIALSLNWINPNLSVRLTPLFFEHISTLPFPLSKYYLRKLIKISPDICPDLFIYLLTKTNQEKFAAEYSVEFFSKNPDFLFEFIYKSLKSDEGKAILAIVNKSKKDDSFIDLLRSYQQLLATPSKRKYISRHIACLRTFVDENNKYSNEILLSYKAFLQFYTLDDLQHLAESDKPLLEILKINYSEQLNPQIIEMFETIVDFAQDVKNYDIVENFRDKQYYLSEARIKLYDLSSQARGVLHEPEKSLFSEIFEKWQGVIASEAKSLRGPADIALTILNKKLNINGENEWQSVVVQVNNNGLSPAENIQLSFLENENAQILEKKKEIRLLGIGEEAKIEFSIKPYGNPNSLRINIDTSFDDFERKNKLRVFADILSIKAPSFEYKKVLNPYIVGTPLKNRNLFVGRNQALKFALDNLSSGSQSNVLIYFGQRRIGKSSILYQLMNSSLNDEYIFVYIDCQGFADADTAMLLYRICRQIRTSAFNRQILIEEPLLDKFKENTFLELDDYFEKIKEVLNGKKIVLMFDEYEFLEYKVKDGKVSADLFDKLRNLMQHQNDHFAFIFVGTHRLTELTENYWSFLFNIALYHEIGTLNEKEAKSLIIKPVEGSIKYDELVVDKILRITGNHPYFIQVICRLLVNYCNDNSKGYINLKDLNEVLDAAVDGSTAHVKYLFNDFSTKSEQEILTFLSRTTDETKLFASAIEIIRFAGENGFEYERVFVEEILSGLKNKKLVRQGGELGELIGFEYEFLRLWIEKHVKIQRGFVNVV